MLKDIFQFIVVTEYFSLEKISKTISQPGAYIIADLEDGVQDVIYPHRTPFLKQSARNRLNAELEKTAGWNNRLHGIRVNAENTPEFKNDLELLIHLRENFHWQFIVIPKVNANDEIKNYINTFTQNNISFSEIIPIIETVKGYDQIENIVSPPPTGLFHRAFWGHHDYNLDAGNFPFFECTSKEYWQLTKQLIGRLEKSGYGYMNGVFPELGNDELFLKIISATAALCTNDFDQAALSYRQVQLLSSAKKIIPLEYSALTKADVLTPAEKISSAEKITAAFEKYYTKDKSFSIVPDTGLFISPQQYMAAKKYLNSVKAEA